MKFGFVSSGMFASGVTSVSVRTHTLLICFALVLITFGRGSELRVRVRLADGQITEEVLEADRSEEHTSELQSR